MRSPETSPRLLVLLGSLLLLIPPLVGEPPPAVASTSEVLTVVVVPAEPTVCDSVTIGVTGALSSPCLQIVSAEITGPVPPNPLCMGPVCPARFEIRITVEEPGIPTPCPAVISPYRRSFRVGVLPAGAYSVRAVEIIQPSAAVSVDIDSTVVSTLFFVQPSPRCPPGPGCYILDFGPPPQVPQPPGFCTTTAVPGGAASFDLLLHNESPVGGMQTQITIYDPRLDVSAYGPIPFGWFTPKAVEAVGRARGFQLDWAADGGALKAILYSTTGASIPPGEGAILRITYGVGADTREGTYVIWHFDEVVSDPDGNALRPCPTLRETSGRLCVARGGCDVNGDGRSDIRDIIRIVRCALAGTGTEACPDSIAVRADCNSDGRVDVRDVICCVRKILTVRASAGNYAVPPIFPDGEATTAGFENHIRWVTPVEGLASIVLRPAAGFGGAEWVIHHDPATTRIRSLTLRESSGCHLEWTGGPDNGPVYAMLFAEGPIEASHPIEIEVAFDRLTGGPSETNLELSGFTVASSAGDYARALPTAPTLRIPAGAVSAPAVYPARPNPFVGESEITFALPQSGRAELRVYDVRGRLVRTLVNEPRAAGVYHERWNGRSEDGRAVSSGIYLVQFRAGGVTQTQRLLRLR
jgi:FlgD Ig-like domain/Dockerin type I domain